MLQWAGMKARWARELIVAGRKRSWKSLATAMGAAFIVLFVLWHISPVIQVVTFDESNLVYDAHRIVEGHVPYRDFFAFIPPGGLYLMSGGPWGWWGRPETGVRWVTALAVLATWGLSWRALKRAAVSPRFPAGRVASLVPLVVFPYAVSAIHHWMATAWYTAAIAVWIAILTRGNSGLRWLTFGVFVGTAGCFLQTEGVFSLILMSIGALFCGSTGREVSRCAGVALSGVGIAILALFGPLACLGALGACFRDVVGWTLTNYHRPGNINDIPFLMDIPDRFRSLWSFAVLGPGVMGVVRALSGSLLYVGLLFLMGLFLAVSAGALIHIGMTRRIPRPEMVVASTLTIFSFGVFWYSGPAWVHLAYLFPPCILLWGVVLARMPLGEGALGGLRRGVSGLVLLGVLCHGPLLVHHIPRPWELLDVDRIDRESPLNESLRESTLLSPGDTIAVFPTGGNVYLYTFPAAIGYSYFFPLKDKYNDLQDHEIAAAQMARTRPALVLIHLVSYADYLVPEDPVGALVQKDYREVIRTPALVVLARKDRLEPSPRSARGRS